MRMRKHKRAKTTALIELLRATTFDHVFGEFLEHWGVRPSITKEDYVGRLSSHFFLPRLSNYKLECHFDGKEVYYFCGNPKKSAPFTLAMIDIDVQKTHKLGSSQGAVAFAEHLRTYWPTLCMEKSRSGNGLGCPIFVKKDGRSAKEVNAMLRKLDRWLKAEAIRIGVDMENVEVKGTLPISEYRNGSVVSIRFGVFARYPRTLTFEELSNSPVLSCEEWLLKDVPEMPRPAREMKVGSAPEKVVSHDVSELRQTRSVMNTGSVSGNLISEDELSMIPQYERLYRKLVGANDLKANARFIVTPHDFAIACVLLRFFKNNPNADGSMPMRRAKAMWNALFEKGNVDRPFNDRRWTCIRNWLSENGHIDWQDDRYQAPNPSQGLRPIACKWEITDEFMDVLNDIMLGGASFVDTVEVKRGPGKWLVPRLCPIQREMEIAFWLDADERVERVMAA